METTIVYWGYLGIMENKMETIIRRGEYSGNVIMVYLAEEVRNFATGGEVSFGSQEGHPTWAAA